MEAAALAAEADLRPTTPPEISRAPCASVRPTGSGSRTSRPGSACLTARHPGLTVQLVPVSTVLLAVQAGGRHRRHHRAAGDGPPVVAGKLVDYTPSASTLREAYLMERGTPETAPGDLGGHDLIGYVEDLLYSASLNYGAEFFTGLGRPVRDRLRARPDGGGQRRRRHRHPARLHRTRRCPGSRAGAAGREDPKRAYWMVTHESSRPLAPCRCRTGLPARSGRARQDHVRVVFRTLRVPPRSNIAPSRDPLASMLA
jgi:hypothetical protein